jgi:hypothetical protein
MKPRSPLAATGGTLSSGTIALTASLTAVELKLSFRAKSRNR